MYSAHMGGASMYGLQGMPMFGGVGGMLASGPSSAPMLSVPLAVPAAHSHPSAFDFASPPQPQARAMQVSSLLSDGPTIEYNAAALPTFPPSSATPAMHTAQRSPSAHSNSSVPPTWESVRAAVAPAIAPTKAVLAAVSASPLVKSECSRKSSKSGGSKGSSKRQPSVHSLQLQNAALQSQLNENLKRINMVHDLVQRISTEGSHPSPSVGDSEAEAECPEQPEEQVHEAQSRYWNDEEHKRFLDAVKCFGSHNHKAIAAYVTTRSAAQVRSHSQKFFKKLETFEGNGLPSMARKRKTREHSGSGESLDERSSSGLSSSPSSNGTSHRHAGPGFDLE
mmetsp:Transcript_21089/g.47565  ORF Transcript_21089/g.47565 Transcript_21089/m.47565 type:complete len:337 (+) Transcript_21089:2-1012(+)